MEGIVGRGYGSEGTVIPGGIEGEVRPPTIALEEGEVRCSPLGIAVDVLAGEGILQLRGERVDTCQGCRTLERPCREGGEYTFDGLVGRGTQLANLTDLLIGFVSRLNLVRGE